PGLEMVRRRGGRRPGAGRPCDLANVSPDATTERSRVRSGADQAACTCAASPESGPAARAGPFACVAPVQPGRVTGGRMVARRGAGPAGRVLRFARPGRALGRGIAAESTAVGSAPEAADEPFLARHNGRPARKPGFIPAVPVLEPTLEEIGVVA